MKKTFALILVLVLCLSLCACGGENPYEKYAKYEELFIALENKDAEAALGYLMKFFASEGGNEVPPTTDQVPTTEDPAQVALRERYSYAIGQLKNFIEYGYVRFMNEAGEEETFENHDATQMLYDEFLAIGDYELAPEILGRFTKLEDVLLMQYTTTVDAFGQQADPQNYIYYFCDKGDHILSSSEDGGTDYVYNAQDQLIGKNEYYGYRYEYSYNEAGLLAEEKYFNGEKISKVTTYTYDEFGNILTEEEKDSNGGIYTTNYTYTYDDQNRIQSHIWEKLDKDGNRTSFQIAPYVCTYDENGYLSVETQEAWNDIYQRLYKYDDQGRMIEKIIRNRPKNGTEEDYKVTKTTTWVYENDHLIQEITETDTTKSVNYQYGSRYEFNAEGLELP